MRLRGFGVRILDFNKPSASNNQGTRLYRTSACKLRGNRHRTLCVFYNRPRFLCRRPDQERRSSALFFYRLRRSLVASLTLEDLALLEGRTLLEVRTAADVPNAERQPTELPRAIDQLQ